MFRKFISKYGLAAHLGMLAAFPLVCMPYLSPADLGGVLLGLSLFVLVWLLAEPSRRSGERTRAARARLGGELLRDPWLYFAIVLVLFALVRWLNAGVTLKYDPEATRWAVSEPAASVLPASVGNTAFLPLATAAALSVFVLTVQHGLGLSARLFCGMTVVTLAGIGGLVAVTMACLGYHAALAKVLFSGFTNLPIIGTAFGFFLTLSVVFGMDAESKKWRAAHLPYVIAVAGCSSGLVFFAPPYAAAVHLAVMALFLVFSCVYCARSGSAGGVAKGVVFTLFGLLVPVFVMLAVASPEVQQAKLKALDPALALPLGYMDLHNVYGRIARDIWKVHPWLGGGMGSYGLHLPFFALKADWHILPPQPVCATSGYWMLLAERGIVGCGVLALGFALLLWSWGMRLVAAFRFLHDNADADIFPFACPPVVWTAPFLFLLALAELWLSPVFRSCPGTFAMIVPLALSAASFPRNVPPAGDPSGDASGSNQG